MNCNSGYGSATHVTGAFGFAASAEIIKAITTAPSNAGATIANTQSA
jgi:tRNA A37 threonylcarbamoyladenosine dehydratase